jgi:hypothetical protein
LTKSDIVALYSIHVTKLDNTVYLMIFLREQIASQEFWKALKNNYVEINMKKERFLRDEIPSEVLDIIRKLEKEEQLREQEAKKQTFSEIKYGNEEEAIPN